LYNVLFVTKDEPAYNASPSWNPLLGIEPSSMLQRGGEEDGRLVMGASSMVKRLVGSCPVWDGQLLVRESLGPFAFLPILGDMRPPSGRQPSQKSILSNVQEGT